MKTFILAIFGLLALANAQEEEYQIDQIKDRKANPEPEAEAYAHPGYEQHAYKRLAKRAAHKLADDIITKKFAEAQIDTSEDREANSELEKAYAHPGYQQPAYKRLAKREAPVAKTNDYYDEAAYADPNAQRYGPPPPAIERLAKGYGYAIAAGLRGYEAPPAQAPDQERLAKAYGYAVATGLGGYGAPSAQGLQTDIQPRASVAPEDELAPIGPSYG